MTDFLKGNFKVKNEVKNSEQIAEVSTEQAFEREAMKRLGGSICFVSKQRVNWGEVQNKLKE